MGEEPRDCGPYELLTEVGRGAMGVVYRARHRDTSEEVALKTVRIPNVAVLQSIRREINALAQTSHPGIVRILDHGIQGGIPWYSMELIDGESLRQYALTERKLQVKEALTVVRRLCGPLAYLHGEGIVHRDLKPENIVFRANGMPVLVDFGLVSRFAARDASREALDASVEAAGTVAYMAPEQGRGRSVDARADLYSLGCILYEILTGRPPFIGATPVEILWQHFESTARAPSELREGIPADIDGLVLRLLAKEPRRRYGHADDLAQALAALGAEDGLAATQDRARAYLYRPNFAGRSDLLAKLERSLTALGGGSGGCVLIGGESGIGKTRLAMELMRRAERARIAVQSGECQPRGSRATRALAGSEEPRDPEDLSRGVMGVPLLALRPLLQKVADRCRERGREETARLLGDRAKLLAPFEPAIDSLDEGDAPEPAEVPADVARRRLYAALTETIRELSRGQPLLLVLDDLQWGDELTLGLLDHWLERDELRSMPVLAVGLYRTEELDSTLTHLIERGKASTAILARLDDASIHAIIADMLGQAEAPPDLSKYVTSQSEGNPFFVAEYLRTAVAVERLFRDRDGRWTGIESATQAEGYEALPLPRSVHELIGQRLETLSAEARMLVDAAAVLGRSAAEDLLQRMTEGSIAPWMSVIKQLLTRQILEELPGGRLRFVHDKIREAAYAAIEPRRRVKLHRDAATAIEAQYGATQDDHGAELGQHWEQGEDSERARRCYLSAATAAAKKYAHAEATRLYRAFLRLTMAPDTGSVEARDALAWEVLQVQGAFHPAIAEYEIALREARQIGYHEVEGRLLRRTGFLQMMVGNAAAAQSCHEQAARINRQLGQRKDEADALAGLAILLRLAGKTEAAREAYGRALELVREVGDRKSEGLVLSNLSLLHQNDGRYRDAVKMLEEALVISREVGDAQVEARTLANLGCGHYLLLEFETAIECLEAARQVATRIGDRRLESFALGNLAAVENDLGRFERARSFAEKALAIAVELREPRNEAVWAALVARVDRHEAKFPEARERLERAESLLRQISEVHFMVILATERGHLELAEGRSAARYVAEAQEVVLRLGAGPESELGQVAMRLQRAEEAYQAGATLLRGERAEDLTERARKRLHQEIARAAHSRTASNA